MTGKICFHKIHTHSEFQSVILFSNGFFIAAIVEVFYGVVTLYVGF